jgi:hypothetical protein
MQIKRNQNLFIKINTINIHNNSTNFPIPKKSATTKTDVSKNKSNALKTELNFKGIINKPFLKPPNEILRKYFEVLKPSKFQDITILFKESEDEMFSNIMLLQEPLSFSKAIDSLDKHINDFHTSKQNFKTLGLITRDFAKYKKAILKNLELHNTKIKGIIGQGASSSAFLTDKNEVIKLSTEPLYPLPDKIIQNVDLPILKTYLIPNRKATHTIYGIKEPLAENSLIRNISDEEYFKLRSYFYTQIKKANPHYDFEKDFSLNPDFAMQIGFYKNKPYILDRQVITNRPLYEHY